MRHDDLVYVAQMLDLCDRILARAVRLEREDFDADEDLRLALTHLVQTLGEAARRVSSGYRAGHPEVPWAEIVGMRHKIVHDYLDVDFDLVWDVCSVEIPRLRPMLASLLPSGPPGS
ncbi:MAG: DUF86 domain-containing protein [Thermoanaerobaculia bacterium]|nr:DUF86 domain-containing protein [Thermoanaerobaculia bacterium]MCZ7651226.1 DUF86 domain-containing protein [Thermoanaerobaculia bacterium]